jgi:hypothetical protein
MDDDFASARGELQTQAAESLRVSRRDFFAGALAGSSLVLAGVPLQAWAGVGGRAATGPVNVQVSRGGIPGRGHFEPSLAVNRRNHRNLLAACMLGPDAYVSFDGGLSWRRGGKLRLPPQSGGGNMSVAFDSSGRGLVCGSFGTPAGTSVLVWRTDDGGRSFAQASVVGTAANLDRPWLATDPQSPGAVHVVWSQGSASGLTTAIRYARSTDAGATFDAPRTIASHSAGLGNPVVACGPAGTAYILYSSGKGAVGRVAPDSVSTVTAVCSQDRGQTFQPPITLGRSTDLVAFPGLRGGTGSALPAIAADPHSGLVCAAFIDHKAGASHADVLLATSHDAGRTWSGATPVTPQDQLIYFQPEVAIDNAGRIGVMAFTMNRGIVNVVLMTSDPGSLHFNAPITVSEHPFDPAEMDYQLGDYQALATTPGAFHPIWSQPHTGQLQLFTTAVPAAR